MPLKEGQELVWRICSPPDTLSGPRKQSKAGVPKAVGLLRAIGNKLIRKGQKHHGGQAAAQLLHRDDELCSHQLEDLEPEEGCFVEHYEPHQRNSGSTKSSLAAAQPTSKRRADKLLRKARKEAGGRPGTGCAALASTRTSTWKPPSQEQWQQLTGHQKDTADVRTVFVLPAEPDPHKRRNMYLKQKLAQQLLAEPSHEMGLAEAGALVVASSAADDRPKALLGGADRITGNGQTWILRHVGEPGDPAFMRLSDDGLVVQLDAEGVRASAASSRLQA